MEDQYMHLDCNLMSFPIIPMTSSISVDKLVVFWNSIQMALKVRKTIEVTYTYV